MLEKTKVKLELIFDVDMYSMVANNIRGGVTTINHRHFISNNKHLSDYNPEEPSCYINYVDANNLYGASLSRSLPTGNYEWIKKVDISKLDVMKLYPDGGTCYILEVDLQYPTNLHDDHTDYLLAVERKTIQENQISDFNRKCLANVNEKFNLTTKLCPDLTDKAKYVISLRNLQFCISQGLVLIKIHRVFTADQRCFLKEYIDFNSRKHLESKSKFSSDFFKLCNNAIYGKFIEDVRKRTNVSVIMDEKKAHKVVAKPQYKGFQVLD